MDFRHLRYFVTLAEQLHMGRAAETLGIAQPALSQQIRALEERLGVMLFLRAHRRLTLTQAGDAFLHKARLALQAAEDAVQEARRTARGEQGAIAIGHVSSAMFDPTLPALLHTFHQRYPDVNLSLQPASVNDLLNGLKNQSLDLAIIRAPHGPLPQELESRLFLREALTLAINEQHPLAGKTPVALTALAQERWLVMTDPEGIGLEHVVRELCRKSGFSPQTGQRVKDVATLVSLVAANLGVGLVPNSATVINLPGVRFLAVESNPESELSVVYRRFEKSAAVKKLLAMTPEAT
ncbi:LysR substrate-binding domain-containing protein [Enterobacillus tribolii]|uniref:DNA-binding transcriptional LysR family regulator n=1 Tax=Enterobacillus tribolii TaxID=1487935 RepID=A0A370QTS2_9GAMM|nr:LysR substrate-binding domain-containing protein [Enterobacillus tribolii]MBW7981290.1 LysR family transcriptional regulator [Enterobacillus tribolii]RDK92648.1 DNA-binding transcriptional LysR family regulator [Enterobacillus tribolii]